MKIGFLPFGHWADVPGSEVRTAKDAYLQAIDLAVAAEELGIDGAYLRVHHFAPQFANPIPLLGALAARTSRIEIGTAVVDMRYDISPDFDEEMHLVGMGKEEYAQTQNTLALAERISDRNARDRQEIDRNSKIVASIREDVIAEREEVSDDLELVSRAKARNAAEAAQNAADRAELHEARVDDAEALSWHRSDAGADILAARVAADEELSELHSLAHAMYRQTRADRKRIHNAGRAGLDAIVNVDDRVRFIKAFDAALAPPTPVPAQPVENRHAAAAKRDRAYMDAERAALTAGGPQQQPRSRTGDHGLVG